MDHEIPAVLCLAVRLPGRYAPYEEIAILEEEAGAANAQLVETKLL